jgi:hypothetical protein
MSITDEMVEAAAEAIALTVWMQGNKGDVPADLWKILKDRPTGDRTRSQARAALQAALSIAS